MTMFFVVASCILFYFALLRLGQISSVFKQFLTVAKPIIYGLAIAYLLNPIVKWIDRRMIPFLEKHCPKLKKKKQISRGVGIFVSVIFSSPAYWTNSRQSRFNSPDISKTKGLIVDVIRILLAIILPPVGVFLQVGIGLHFWLNILLTLCGYVPGIIHAIWVILRK